MQDGNYFHPLGHDNENYNHTVDGNYNILLVHDNGSLITLIHDNWNKTRTTVGHVRP